MSLRLDELHHPVSVTSAGYAWPDAGVQRATIPDLTDLSVIIVSWNSLEYLSACLSSVYAAANGDPIEVIVIDNGSVDGSPDLIRHRFPAARLIVNDQNRGCTVAFNQGLHLSTGQYVLLLCSDTVVQPAALHRMRAFLEAHPDAGAVGPQLRYPDGRLQPSCRAFPTYTTFVWEFMGFSRLFPAHPVFGRWRMGDFDHQALREVDQPRGSSLMVRREVVSQVGLMDEQFEMFFNDVDWCLRMKQQGWKIYFLPSARLIHHGGGSVRKVRPRMILMSHRSCYRFFKKYQRSIGQAVATRILGLALLASAGIRYLIARATGPGYRFPTQPAAPPFELRAVNNT
ncbi:MAG: glycosyltransferase family 2 protein [Candidatus Latescibacteria bacterium]|nr:glycosyltransferase family 2 protein [Candidatus Latescibacterota bacterium]